MSEQETSNRTRLVLEKRHQLIDLNKDYVNFDITFECRALDATKDFEIIVVTQEQLNTIDLTNLTMKRTKGGYISGNIIADEDKYQNYFLIMRSPTDETIEVDLDTRIRQIEAKQPIAPQSPPDLPVSPLAPPEMVQPILEQPFIPPVQNRSHLIFMVVGLLIIGGAVGYYFWKNKKPLLTVHDDAVSVCSASSHSSSSSDEAGILNTLIHKSKS